MKKSNIYVLFFLAIAAFASYPKNTLAADPGVEVSYICKGSPIPANWILVAQLANGNPITCASGFVYAIESSAGRSSAIMCPGAPLPSGWVVSGSSGDNRLVKCPAGSYFLVINNTVGQTTLASCPGYPLPSTQWIVSAEVPEGARPIKCPATSYFYRIESVVGQDTMIVCPQTPFPTTWVVIAVRGDDRTTGKCTNNGNGKFNVIRTTEGKTEMGACPGNVLPVGWVIDRQLGNVGEYLCPGGFFNRIVHI